MLACLHDSPATEERHINKYSFSSSPHFKRCCSLSNRIWCQVKADLPEKKNALDLPQLKRKTRNFNWRIDAFIWCALRSVESRQHPRSPFHSLPPLGKVMGEGSLWNSHDRICCLHGVGEGAWVSELRKQEGEGERACCILSSGELPSVASPHFTTIGRFPSRSCPPPPHPLTPSPPLPQFFIYFFNFSGQGCSF